MKVRSYSVRAMLMFIMLSTFALIPVMSFADSTDTCTGTGILGGFECPGAPPSHSSSSFTLNEGYPSFPSGDGGWELVIGEPIFLGDVYLMDAGGVLSDVVRFDYRFVPSLGFQYVAVLFQVDGPPAMSFPPPPISPWTTISIDENPTTPTVYVADFDSASGPYPLCHNGENCYTIGSVETPEPGTIAFFATGALLMLGLGRKFAWARQA